MGLFTAALSSIQYQRYHYHSNSKVIGKLESDVIGIITQFGGNIPEDDIDELMNKIFDSTSSYYSFVRTYFSTSMKILTKLTEKCRLSKKIITKIFARLKQLVAMGGQYKDLLCKDFDWYQNLVNQNVKFTPAQKAFLLSIGAIQIQDHLYNSTIDMRNIEKIFETDTMLNSILTNVEIIKFSDLLKKNKMKLQQKHFTKALSTIMSHIYTTNKDDYVNSMTLRIENVINLFIKCGYSVILDDLKTIILNFKTPDGYSSSEIMLNKNKLLINYFIDYFKNIQLTLSNSDVLSLCYETVQNNGQQKISILYNHINLKLLKLEQMNDLVMLLITSGESNLLSELIKTSHVANFLPNIYEKILKFGLVSRYSYNGKPKHLILNEEFNDAFKYISSDVMFKYACLYGLTTIIDKYLETKFIPQKEHVLHYLKYVVWYGISNNTAMATITKFISYGLALTDEICEMLTYILKSSLLTLNIQFDSTTKNKIEQIINKISFTSDGSVNISRIKKTYPVEIELQYQFISGTLSQIAIYMAKFNLKPNKICFENALLNHNGIYNALYEQYNYKPNVISIMKIPSLKLRYLVMKEFYPELCMIDYDDITTQPLNDDQIIPDENFEINDESSSNESSSESETEQQKEIAKKIVKKQPAKKMFKNKKQKEPPSSKDYDDDDIIGFD